LIEILAVKIKIACRIGPYFGALIAYRQLSEHPWQASAFRQFLEQFDLSTRRS
jgi:hypothetical protein